MDGIDHERVQTFHLFDRLAGCVLVRTLRSYLHPEPGKPSVCALPAGASVGTSEDGVCASVGADIDRRRVLRIERDGVDACVVEALPIAAAVRALVEACVPHRVAAGVDDVSRRNRERLCVKGTTLAPGAPTIRAREETLTERAGVGRLAADRNDIGPSCRGAEARPGPGPPGVNAPDDPVPRNGSEDVFRVDRVRCDAVDQLDVRGERLPVGAAVAALEEAEPAHGGVDGWRALQVDADREDGRQTETRVRCVPSRAAVEALEHAASAVGGVEDLWRSRVSARPYDQPHFGSRPVFAGLHLRPPSVLLKTPAHSVVA